MANRNVMLNGTTPDGCACYFLIDLICNENFMHCFISRLLQSSRKHSSWPSSSRVVRHRFRLPPARRRLQLLARLRLRSLRQQLGLDLPPCPTQQFWWDSAYTSLHTVQAHGNFLMQSPWVRGSGKLTHGFCRMTVWCCGAVPELLVAQHTDTLGFYHGNKKFQFLFYKEVDVGFWHLLRPPLPPCLVAVFRHQVPSSYCCVWLYSKVRISNSVQFKEFSEYNWRPLTVTCEHPSLKYLQKSQTLILYTFVHFFPPLFSGSTANSS